MTFTNRFMTVVDRASFIRNKISEIILRTKISFTTNKVGRIAKKSQTKTRVVKYMAYILKEFLRSFYIP